ncbi:MAG: hypothetical protein E6J32_09550 [Chloroflexi bacterium]|nr:MAG: hypothetical protein E6J32_09550 [Chloroflexota bacterium]
MLLGSAIFVAAGIGFVVKGGYARRGLLGIHDERIIGWLIIALFAAGLPVSLITLFSRRLFLELGPEGFILGSLRGVKRRAWNELSGFGVRSLGRAGRRVVYKLAGSPPKRSVGVLVPSSVDYDGILPDTYGMSADKLAILLEEWRQRYGSSSARD